MLYIIAAVAVVAFVVYKLHITSMESLKSAVSAEVTKLESAIVVVEPAIKAELDAVLSKIKALL